MAIEKNGQMTYVDEAGNEYLLFPKTKIHQVEGLESALEGKAPAGYGLGTTAKELTNSDDLNNIWQNGNYWWNWSTPVNAPIFDYDTKGAYAYMRVDSRDDGAYTQTIRSFHAPNIGLTIIRTKTGDTIIEEWVNPPMIPDVEYRTTKRHNGKVVFTQLIDFGALPSNGQKNLDISAPNLESLISATVSTKVIQTGRDVNKDITRIAVYHNSIEVTTEREMGQDAEITIEYTKSMY